jgi:hypothetical protein
VNEATGVEGFVDTRTECEKYGHDYDHYTDFAGNLLKIGCAVCNRVWKVEEK